MEMSSKRAVGRSRVIVETQANVSSHFSTPLRKWLTSPALSIEISGPSIRFALRKLQARSLPSRLLLPRRSAIGRTGRTEEDGGVGEEEHGVAGGGEGED